MRNLTEPLPSLANAKITVKITNHFQPIFRNEKEDKLSGYTHNSSPPQGDHVYSIPNTITHSTYNRDVDRGTIAIPLYLPISWTNISPLGHFLQRLADLREPFGFCAQLFGGLPTVLDMEYFLNCREVQDHVQRLLRFARVAGLNLG